ARHRVKRLSAVPNRRRSWADADQQVHAGADGGDLPAGGERRAGGRGVPPARDRRADLLPLEKAARRHQHERAEGAPPAPRGKSEAEAARRRSVARQDDSPGGADKKVLTPIRWRVLVAWAERSYRLTQRRACGALGAARSSVRYIGVRPLQEALRA